LESVVDGDFNLPESEERRPRRSTYNPAISLK